MYLVSFKVWSATEMPAEFSVASVETAQLTVQGLCNKDCCRQQQAIAVDQ